METKPSSFLVLSFVLALAPVVACSSTQSPSDAAAGEAGPDVPAASACAALDACACLAAPACVPVAEACWCPYPACNASAACVCGGGQFLSCAPR